jgi:hypothetical protein
MHPIGFREGVAGLLLPDELSRVRIVIGRDEYKAMVRAIEKFLGPHQIKFLMLCDVDGCSSPRIEKMKAPDGSVLLRCGHADRVCPDAF